ncbi:sugar transferase [Ligilactobacillus sp. Marseille-Q7487]|uniref:sugar transferase n=1 Tax=Ligilactobacillus sp. Marseille-Q7487 TaxID=3022128 RepID=UPI0024A891A8|nr:sugar transferase [Ligilactobacillus sp. Marseille-Q7487]
MKNWKSLEKKYGVKRHIYRLFFKRLFDIIISFIGVVLCIPIFCIIIVLVKINLGSPVFFKQKRVGKDEKVFDMIKFRTMLDARDEDGNLLSDEQRFTRFGNFMRTSSLDELPELWNVLKGDMSLVGPRPLYPVYLPYYKEKETLRHSVRGGITGLAQVNGRALLKWDERFEKDVEYVKNMSFFNDIKIIFLTFYKIVKKSDIGIPSVEDEVELNLARKVERPEYLDIEFNDVNYMKNNGKRKNN